MPKNKPNKGLLKRIRITKSGRIKLRRSGGRHLRSHKTGKLRRSYRVPKYAVSCEGKRFSSMLFLPVRTSTAEDASAESSSKSTDRS